MSRILPFLFLVLSLGDSFIHPLEAQQIKREKVVELMGVRFEFAAAAATDTLAWQSIEAGIAEVRRVEALISSWQSTSQTSEINRQAGIRPVSVDWELFQLIRRAKRISGLTEGAFDVSFAAAERMWTFDGREIERPPDSLVQASVAQIGYQHILLEDSDTSVFLTRIGMKIGFGAIGKGYAANRAKAVMQQFGSESGLVGAGGDLLSWGMDESGQAWQVGIADPAQPNRILAYLPVHNQAVVTSGDYEKYLWMEGERYAHIIDPRTGYPTKGLRSVTLLCPDAELADALATATFVLGAEAGLALINQLRGVEALLLTSDGQWLQSAGIELKLEDR